MMNDLVPKLNDKLTAEEYYGEVVWKYEAGKIVLVRVHQDLKREGLMSKLKN